MSNPTMALVEYSRKSGLDLYGGILREMAQTMTPVVMEMAMEQQIGSPDEDTRATTRAPLCASSHRAQRSKAGRCFS